MSKLTLDQFESHAKYRKALATANRYATVDRLLRAIFDSGCTNVYDADDGHYIRCGDDLIDLWYNLDELTVMFTLPSGEEVFILLIHQTHVNSPDEEDLCDYSCRLEKEPWFSQIVYT